VCGGCTWQHAEIEAQRTFKTQQVKEAVAHTGGLSPDIVRKIIECDVSLGYRNKMEYSFGSRKWMTAEEIASGVSFPTDGIYAGLHAPGRFDKILDLTECHLQPDPSFALLKTVKSWMIQHQVTAYDPVQHTGFMRNLVVRNSPKTSQWMVNVVTNGENEKLFDSLTHSLLSEFPFLTTVLFTINDTRSPVAYGKPEIVTHGDGKILEKLEDLSFWIRPQTFFQTNTLQAETLFRIAREAILSQRSANDQMERSRLLDLY
jgi:23S rRNA (uracil1939-C5)-methyltransferase